MQGRRVRVREGGGRRFHGLLGCAFLHRHHRSPVRVVAASGVSFLPPPPPTPTSPASQVSWPDGSEQDANGGSSALPTCRPALAHSQGWSSRCIHRIGAILAVFHGAPQGEGPRDSRGQRWGLNSGARHCKTKPCPTSRSLFPRQRLLQIKLLQCVSFCMQKETNLYRDWNFFSRTKVTGEWRGDRWCQEGDAKAGKAGGVASALSASGGSWTSFSRGSGAESFSAPTSSQKPTAVTSVTMR